MVEKDVGKHYRRVLRGPGSPIKDSGKVMTEEQMFGYLMDDYQVAVSAGPGDISEWTRARINGMEHALGLTQEEKEFLIGLARENIREQESKLEPFVVGAGIRDRERSRPVKVREHTRRR